MKLKISKVNKKSNPYHVSKEFMIWVKKFSEEHKDALRELAKR